MTLQLTSSIIVVNFISAERGAQTSSVVHKHTDSYYVFFEKSETLSMKDADLLLFISPERKTAHI